MMIILSLFSLMLCCTLILINSLIAKKSKLDREKLSPFECGFDPKTSSRIPLSLRFYLIAVIFLIFDVEITLILPMPILIHQLNSLMPMIIIIYFILILLIGLIHEWNQGALNWDD